MNASHANPPTARNETGKRPFGCPFCALACDDLSLPLNTLPCRKAQSGFEAALATPDTASPRIKGRLVDWDEAVATAANRLQNARLPLIHGMIGDLRDAKASLKLAEHFGGVVDHLHGDAIARTLRVYQDSGWQITSLGEVRNRADLVVFVGDALDEALPRLREQVLDAGERLHTPAGPQHIQLPTDCLDTLLETQALLTDHPMTPNAPDATPLAEALAGAAYPVFLLAASTHKHAEAVLRALVGLVRHLNETGRAALLPLGGGEGATTAQSCAAWHTGFGIRTRMSRGYPQQDLDGNAADRLLQGESDLLVWVNSLNNEPPPATDIPQIVFARPDAPAALVDTADVFLPVAIPGVDRAGFIHRADGLRLVPLRSLRESTLPDSQDLAERLIGTARSQHGNRS